jgi:phospholipid/cholesterol/gamma-HCH transport system ATP-binding protein
LSNCADSILCVRDLQMEFASSRGVARILKGVTFDVQRGETIVIMGGSGSGKSTLLNCLIGEYQPTGGGIIYHLPERPPCDLCSAKPAELDEIRRSFGILFQSGALFSSMTVAENVALPLREHSAVDPAVIDIVVAMKLQQVHMLEHRHKLPSQLSGGQKKRVGLARATALDPLILFYDEPSAGLDPVTSSAIDELIISLSKQLNVTSIVVTHEMDSAFTIADRMVMLVDGRVMRIGPREEFEAIRDAQTESLTSQDDQLIHQFLNGAAHGPITDRDRMAEYERILQGDTTVVRPAG